MDLKQDEKGNTKWTSPGRGHSPSPWARLPLLCPHRGLALGGVAASTGRAWVTAMLTEGAIQSASTRKLRAPAKRSPGGFTQQRDRFPGWVLGVGDTDAGGLTVAHPPPQPGGCREREGTGLLSRAASQPEVTPAGHQRLKASCSSLPTPPHAASLDPARVHLSHPPLLLSSGDF